MNVVNLDSPGLNVPFEVMVLEGDVLRSRREFLRSRHPDARLVVLPNFAKELRCFHQKREHCVEFIHDCHQRNHFAQRRRKSNVLGFSGAQGDLCLKLARPVDRAVGVFNDETRPGHQVARIVWVGLIPPTSEIRIDVTFKPLREVDFVFYSSISRIEKISANASDGLLVT